MKFENFANADYLVYENQILGILVAIEKSEQKVIKSFWKKNKGKKDIPADTISAFQFVHDEEQDSLKIDFSAKNDYPIKELVKFE